MVEKAVLLLHFIWTALIDDTGVKHGQGSLGEKWVGQVLMYFTQEALCNVHNNNERGVRFDMAQRGVCSLVIQIIGFASEPQNRYGVGTRIYYSWLTTVRDEALPCSSLGGAAISTAPGTPIMAQQRHSETRGIP